MINGSRLFSYHANVPTTHVQFIGSYVIFIPNPKFGVAHWREPSENQPFDRNDPYNQDQESI